MADFGMEISSDADVKAVVSALAHSVSDVLKQNGIENDVEIKWEVQFRGGVKLLRWRVPNLPQEDTHRLLIESGLQPWSELVP